MCVVGEQDLAVGLDDVAGQRLASAGVVDAAQHVTAQPRGRHGGEHLGGVAQQRSHVQRPPGVGERDQRGRLPRRLVEVFAPSPDPVTELHRRGGIVEVLAQQLLDGLGH